MASQVEYMRATFEFIAENIHEMSFREGDLIRVVKYDEEGWSDGELVLSGNTSVIDRPRGLFPNNYCEPCPPPHTKHSHPPHPSQRVVASPTLAAAPPKNSPSLPPSKLLLGRSPPSSNSNSNSSHLLAPQSRFAPSSSVSSNGVPASNSDSNSNSSANNKSTAAATPSPASSTAAPSTSAPAAASSTPASYKVNIPASSSSSSSSPSLIPPSTSTSGQVAQKTTRFGLWASNMAIASASVNIIGGLSAILWHFLQPNQFLINYVWVGCYVIASGVGVLVWEFLWGTTRTATKLPWRGVAYALISIPCYFCELLAYCGVFYVSVAAVEFAATYNQEAYAPPKKKEGRAETRARSSTTDAETPISPCDMVYAYFATIRHENRTGAAVFLVVYFAGNLALFVDTVVVYWTIIANTAPAQQTTEWVAIARGFGYVLDMNCAVVLLPVCRSMLRTLYNRSTADQGWVSRTLRAILFFIPVDHNLKFHRIVAWFIAFSALGHTLAHIINYAIRPTITFSIYGLWPLLSGGIIVHIMLFMYASSLQNTRIGQFEVFWYTHHLFFFFFLFLLIHGRGGLGPHFWYCFIAPGALYLLERLLRLYRANQSVVILSVQLMGDVFCIEMEKTGIFAEPHKEGQYIFVNSPSIALFEWHPFTISSPPQSKTVTVHMKVQSEGSWTRLLRDRLASMGPRNRSYFTLDRAAPQGKLPGKIIGPDGSAMLRLDGPYAAPTQHLGEYEVDVVVGAGIGVTPVAAALRSVIFHRWKYFIGQCYPDHAYFVVVCSHKDIDGFRWLMRIIKDAQDEVVHMRTTNPEAMSKKTFEVHIYITSVPEKRPAPPPRPTNEDEEIRLWGRPHEDTQVDRFRATKWDEHMLYAKMVDPSPHTIMGYEEVSLINTATPAGGVSVVSDVHVYAGRPRWDALFNRVSKKHPNNRVGVQFCGSPMIAKDLSRMCFKMNRTRKERFVFYKENF